MSKWEKVRLGDYIQEYSERNKTDADIPVYSVTNSNGFCTEYFSKEVASKDKTTYKLVKQGFFAYNPSRINVGSIDWLRDEEVVIVSPLYNVFSVNDSLYQQYLYYYLKSPIGLYYIKELATGSVRDNLKLSTLAEFSIPLPPIEEQRAISANLDKVTHTIDLCNAILEKLDLLVKSRFVEMFGDLIENDRQWENYLLCNIADIVSGITKGRKVKETELIEVPYMAVSNVKDGYIDWTTVKTILATASEIEQYRIQPEDILMTEGGDPDKLGRGAIIHQVPENCIHQNHIFRVRLDEAIILPLYFSEYLQAQKAKRYFFSCAKQTTGIASINMKQLKSLPVLVPPLALQQQFAAFVEQTDKSKLAVKQVLEKAETLKKALMQEYFG